LRKKYLKFVKACEGIDLEAKKKEKRQKNKRPVYKLNFMKYFF